MDEAIEDGGEDDESSPRNLPIGETLQPPSPCAHRIAPPATPTNTAARSSGPIIIDIDADDVPATAPIKRNRRAPTTGKSPATTTTSTSTPARVRRRHNDNNSKNTEPVAHFLRSLTPELSHLLPAFVRAGCDDGVHLRALALLAPARLDAWLVKLSALAEDDGDPGPSVLEEEVIKDGLARLCEAGGASESG
jgi:hypothetical protein